MLYTDDCRIMMWLAGAISRLGNEVDAAVRRAAESKYGDDQLLVEEALVPFNYALNSCTINPAKCLHLDDRKGSIQVGKDADLVVLEDNYDVLQTYCMGQPKL